MKFKRLQRQGVLVVFKLQELLPKLIESLYFRHHFPAINS